ncbi:hypothetical protein [Rhizobium sp. S163]|uniref:hypothetical protein n=1 Tax=Rhizobium sp. S163 TaxID=3055039 RepID=UPI0025A99875|nr:hypothetical protein [Rhizobium sp. S163]MDM9648305.1 hypothetical protein [Rhizobium sp. S163]
MRAIIDDLITLPQTVEITGIPRHQFRPVAKAGFIREFTGLPINGVGGPKYLVKEVTEIVERFRAMTAAASTSEMKTLIGYARLNSIDIGSVLASTLQGDIYLAGLDLSRNGLRALYFEPVKDRKRTSEILNTR